MDFEYENKGKVGDYVDLIFITTCNVIAMLFAKLNILFEKLKILLFKKANK